VQKRHFGTTDLAGSALGLGCRGMSYGYGPTADKQGIISRIRSAVEHGLSCFETAEAYDPFTNLRMRRE
jgi:aryl-alcohol dehydrogenase-like predicted oxidoreductase